MTQQKFKTIKIAKIIEWESSKQNTGGRTKEPSITPDVYQIFEWIIRQAMHGKSVQIGFDTPKEAIRLSKIPDPKKYIAAILKEIHREEQDRLIRFRHAQEFYDYHANSSDLELSNTEIQKFYDDIGVTGKTAGAWGELLTVERPDQAMSYGFERICLPRTSQLIGLKQAISEIGFSKHTSLTKSQIRSMRRKLGWAGNYLVQEEENKWSLDFTNVPLINHLIYISLAVYKNFENRPRNIHQFIGQKISYLFRDDQRMNARDFKLGLSADKIRNRIKGDEHGKKLSQYETLLSDLLNEAVYDYLSVNSGRLRSELTQYLKG